MPKAFAILGLIVGLCLLLVFGLDLGTGFPFNKASKAMDIGFVICALSLSFMSWTTLREQR
ncbi:MAG TPA: hypothetical protein VHY20_10770 [Pirellulales bacterium]|jgi:hypothetical protein|nr:hypothetical protein [Pirellulales bacterium]